MANRISDSAYVIRAAEMLGAKFSFNRTNRWNWTRNAGDYPTTVYSAGKTKLAAARDFLDFLFDEKWRSGELFDYRKPEKVSSSERAKRKYLIKRQQATEIEQRILDRFNNDKAL
jgi:hypothetical protein